MTARLAALDPSNFMHSAAGISVEVRPGFLRTRIGHLHLVEYVATGNMPAGSVLIAPPFAEEMNHSRRMVHLLGRRLAAQGYRVVSADLLGTGDSSGAFEDATVEAWLDDLASVRAWCELGSRVAAIIGIRFGALLAAAHHRERPAGRLVLWDPVLRGEDHLREFLRLRVVADQFRGRASGVSNLRELETRLAAGETLQVAGYSLNSVLAAGMRTLELAPLLAGTRHPVHWMQMGPAEQNSL